MLIFDISSDIGNDSVATRSGSNKQGITTTITIITVTIAAVIPTTPVNMGHRCSVMR